MRAEIDIYSRKPNMAAMQLAGGVLLVIALAATLTADWTSPAPRFELLILPWALGGTLLYVGLTGRAMRRKLAHLSAAGPQVGVHGRIPWNMITRIERRGSGFHTSLVLIPEGKDPNTQRPALKRFIYVGRAEGHVDTLVEEIIQMARRSGLNLSADGTGRVWTTALATAAPNTLPETA